MDIKDLLKDANKYLAKEVKIEGWIKSHRTQKEFGFINLNDGTNQNGIQVVYDKNIKNFNNIVKILIGSAVGITGILVKSEGSGQEYELKANKIEVYGLCPDDFPLQAKGRPTREFLREIAHLRPRTNLFRAVFKIRSVTSQLIHEYFQDRNYVYVHTPLITTSDCEGSEQMFRLTTLDPLKENKDYSKDLFGKEVFITGSGQLHGETFAMAYKKIYTFGPTFRTENSNTKTHANEFWMIEPEIAFCDLDGLMDIEEDMLKFIVSEVLKRCPDEIDFLNNYVDNNLRKKLEKLVKSKFTRINHKDVIDILLKAPNKWEFTPKYDGDIAKEHEKYITNYFDGPVFITNWPKDIKAWYMKQNDDGKTVAAVDLQVPGAGELIGGSQREENMDKLIRKIKEDNIDLNTVDWFVALRKYGTCIHSGFGMGFERLIIYLTGIDNIRDVIPFPRTPGSCEY